MTKESGKSGGFLEKVQAAEEAKAVLVVVGRPFEVGKILKETKKIPRNMGRAVLKFRKI